MGKHHQSKKRTEVVLSSSDLLLLAKAALAGALGFVIGWERETHGHRAGIRTIALVAIAATILTALARDEFPVSDRIVASVVAGVGFLGAGMILHNTKNIQGLTTAASVWAVTGIGIVIGTGRYVLGVLLAGIVLILLWWQYAPLLSRLVPRVTRERLARERENAASADPNDPLHSGKSG